MKNDNALATIALCSRLCPRDGVKPYESSEWAKLAKILVCHKLQPRDLFDLSVEAFQGLLGFSDDESKRLTLLLGRASSLAFEIDRYETRGIRIVTRSDSDYPAKLKKSLGHGSPPLFYYAGNLEILDIPLMAFVGSRTVGPQDGEFASSKAAACVQQGYGIVSGGAKGVDSIAALGALAARGYAVEFLADSLERKLKRGDVVDAVQKGALLLLSSVNPSAGFSSGLAMARNRFIYASAQGAVVVKSDLGKGGTWEGATENIKNAWCPAYCWDNPAYPGNQELIRLGARPIAENWEPEQAGSSSLPGEKRQRASQMLLL